ncbi:hypothetical protein [Maridesulfovibrio frigidus]|uniref:hypothetical protein n=1 Tax=Maridesulfovibrio frigidus TaxID=340956 RepID=UPI0004E27A8F|nr:hypothetical protein [Maridesulfovibrio frigidus]
MTKKVVFPIIILTLQLMLFVSAATAKKASGEVRPYADDSPWNMPIGPNPSYDAYSSGYTDAMNGVFGSDATRYTMPVYIVNSKTPMSKVVYSGKFSEVTRKGRRVKVHKAGIISAPIPADAKPAAGRDGQIIVWNPDTGEEWGFWRIEKSGNSWICTNLYKYNTKWKGIPPYGFLSRGAGVPYLVGLIRPWEIKRGKIEHAIAFGMNYPSRLNIPPSTRSDGRDMFPNPPMGTRLQLDPSLSEADFKAWGLDRTGCIIARALQEYGMILIDTSGHPKIYAEYEGTAQWGKTLLPKTIRAIPYSAFRVLDLRTPSLLPPPAEARENNGIITWKSVRFANRYQVERRCEGSDYKVVARGIEGTSWTGNLLPGCDYVIRAVNYNGLGRASARVRIRK